MGLENRPEYVAPPEMAGLIHDKDWSATPLGPLDGWSPNLRLVVQLVLASGFPMAVRWGPDFVMIYNDGYRAILGDKHPWALGLPFHVAWPEVQDDLRSLHESILSGERGAFFGKDFLLRIQRRGRVRGCPLHDQLQPDTRRCCAKRGRRRAHHCRRDNQ